MEQSSGWRKCLVRDGLPFIVLKITRYRKLSIDDIIRYKDAVHTIVTEGVETLDWPGEPTQAPRLPARGVGLPNDISGNVTATICKISISKTSLATLLTESTNDTVHDPLYSTNDTVHDPLYSTHDTVHDQLYSTNDAVHDPLYSTNDTVHDPLYSTHDTVHDPLYSTNDTVHDQLYSTNDTVHDPLYSTNDTVHDPLYSTNDTVHDQLYSTNDTVHDPLYSTNDTVHDPLYYLLGWKDIVLWKRDSSLLAFLS
ncbi:hypothetical protein J6590_062451 [Homalodisca vitripennis]|nr:hypothetical protein J6590_062451 [Homalodisca vitripennis]